MDGTRWLLCLGVAAFLLAGGSARAQTPFSDAELTRGFLLTVFGAERGAHAGSGIVKKFPRPVRYRIVSTGSIDWSETVRAFAASLDQAVANLSLAEAVEGEDANMTIFLVNRADYRRVIAETVWDGVDVDFLGENACSAVLAARPSGIERANIYIAADEGFLGLSHCLVEELLQSLGPANDSDALPDSIFNDTSDLSVFGVFDWFIVSMLYDPRIAAGMTEADVRPLLPGVIADARARLETLFAEGAPALAHSGQPATSAP